MPKNLANGYFRFFFLITWLLATPLAADASCDKARFLAAGDGLEITPGDTPDNNPNHAVEWLEVQAFEHGLLHIEVSTSHFEKQPIVGFWGFECGARTPIDRASIVHRSPEHVTLQVDAFQTAYFRVAAPKSGDDSLHVRTALVPLGPPTKGGEDEEIIELDGLRAPPQQLCERRDDATKGGEDEEIIELDGFQAPPRGFAGRADDHSASLACATYAGNGRKLAGRLHEPGDIDTFRIWVGSADAQHPDHGLWRLHLGAGSSDDLRVALYDADGLSLSDDPRQGTALAAGFYFLRVGSHETGAGTSHAVAGEYLLTLDVEPW